MFVTWWPPVQNDTNVDHKVVDEIVNTLNDANLGYWAFSTNRDFPSNATQPVLKVTLKPKEGQNQGIVTFQFLKDGKEAVGTEISQFGDLSISLGRDGGWIRLVGAIVKALLENHVTELAYDLRNLPFTATVAGLPEKIPFRSPTTVGDLTIRRGLNPSNNTFVLNATSSNRLLQFCSRASTTGATVDKTFLKTEIVIAKYKWGTDFVDLNHSSGPLLTVTKPLKPVAVQWNWNNDCNFSDNSSLTSPSVAPH